MPIQLICWNLQKISASNVDAKADNIAQAMNQSVRTDKPWLLAILECKDSGVGVGERLRQKLVGDHARVAQAGGGTHTSERVVLVAGQGCVITSAQPHTEWRDTFTQLMADSKQQFALDQASSRRSTRQAAVDSSALSQQTAQGAVWTADNCRDPVIAQVMNKATGETVSVAFVHAPGPSAKHMLQKGAAYAKAYFTSITASLADVGVHAVMGDFNLYSEDDFEPSGDWDLTKLSAAIDQGRGTTYKTSGERSTSELDRAFLTSRFVRNSTVKYLDGSITASDHLGVLVDLEDVDSDVRMDVDEPATA